MTGESFPPGSHSLIRHRSRSQTNDRGLWFGNETTCAHEYNILECKGQQPASAVNNFIDQGEFVAMKTLSGSI